LVSFWQIQRLTLKIDEDSFESEEIGFVA
jgi:hypothetical protein